jgi:hypothetical protein
MAQIYSLAFYNLENLFDPLDDEATLDKGYTPQGAFKWNREKYMQKIEHLSRAMSLVGRRRSTLPPVLLGVCEVENESCLHDLINSEHLKPFDYGYVFHRSLDSRGIHVGLLFQKAFFKVSRQQGFPVDLNSHGEEEYTRDILYVHGHLFDEEIHLLLNHWPSRTDGTQKTNFKRNAAAKLLHKIVDDINAKNSNAQLLIMGDFNDDPYSKCIQNIGNGQFINPMERFHKQKKGSIKFKGKWIMFDQILFNKTLEKSSWWNFLEAQIFVAPFLIQKSGRHKGSPKRTYLGKYHQGGYSDHFPVFIYFEVEQQLRHKSL